ncbi:MAG: hypothetical protein ABI054_13650 [Planctomycetota bacterium]
MRYPVFHHHLLHERAAFSLTRLLLAVALVAALALGSRAQTPAPAAASPSVGMPARITEVVLPGSELEVKAADAKSPLVLRITRVSQHGTAWRYDFEYVGLEPGKFDLRDYLRRRDGTPLVTASDAPDAVPSIPVEVASVLAPGVIKPHSPAAGALPGFGGYKKLMIAGGVVWLAGLAAILFGWRRRRQALAAANWKPRTLAERLRPLVENAIAGKLSREERAQLELGLVAYWRRKLTLDEERPAQMMARLRQHEQAGPLLTSLEAWLHMPAPPEKVDLEHLLAPYRDLPADAIPEIDARPLAIASRG